jgi:hypothetical protein
MLAHTLAAMDTQYFFFLAANDVDLASENFPWINSLHQSRWCHENKNIYKLNNFSLFNWAKENDDECDPLTGHLSVSGHEKFSKFLIEILEETQLVKRL